MEEEELIKAKGGKADDDENDDGEDGYDASYMKKHMKRYMKENSSACKKAAEEVGIINEKMIKATELIDTDSAGAVVEMEDLKPFLEEQTQIMSDLTKAITTLADQIMVISDSSEKSYDLMQKAGKVQVEQAKVFNEFLAVPQGRKGITASADMKKATSVNISKEDNDQIYQVLFKATKEGNRDAGIVISAFESAGHDATKLNKKQKQFISELLNKEGGK
jgi:hypothetical protein